MKNYNKIFLLLFLIVIFQKKSFSQNDSGIVDLKVQMRPVMLDDSTTQQMSIKPITSYVVLVFLKFKNLSGNKKIHIKVGQTQNSASVLNQTLKIMEHVNNPPNNRCVHTDNAPDVEFGLIVDNMFYYKLTVTNPNDFDNIKWVTVYTTGPGAQESTKKYYNIQ